MTDYAIIESVLAGYFNANVGNSEQEAISLLRKALANDVAFRSGFTDELRQAFADDSIAWADMFARHDAAYFDDEDQAKDYARCVLWETAFAS